MKNKIYFIPYLLLMLSGLSCEKLFTGMGPQPTVIDETAYEARLNVLGVLRPDSLDGEPASFVHVEKTADADIEDSTKVWDVAVQVIAYQDDVPADTLHLAGGQPGDTPEEAYYRNAALHPQTGRTYGLICKKAGYPTLTALTTVPQMPEIVEGSWQISGKKLSFTLRRDETASIYELAVTQGDWTQQKRVRRPETGDVPVTLDLLSAKRTEATLTVYAYDLNLSEYLTYNVSIKPNTYVAEYSTVEGGFGCFGSLNLIRRVFTH